MISKYDNMQKMQQEELERIRGEKFISVDSTDFRTINENGYVKK